MSAALQVLPQRQLLQTKYGDQYWCPDLPSEFGSCETGVVRRGGWGAPCMPAPRKRWLAADGHLLPGVPAFTTTCRLPIHKQAPFVRATLRLREGPRCGSLAPL